MLCKPILWAHFYFFLTFFSLEVSRETRSTAVCSRQTDFEVGIACFCPSMVLLFYPGALSTALKKALTDHAKLNVLYSVSIQLNK